MFVFISDLHGWPLHAVRRRARRVRVVGPSGWDKRHQDPPAAPAGNGHGRFGRVPGRTTNDPPADDLWPLPGAGAGEAEWRSAFAGPGPGGPPAAARRRHNGQEGLNARHARNVPGRPKTGKLDAVWFAKVAERGMCRPGTGMSRLVRAPALPATIRIRLPSASATCCDRPPAKVFHLHSNHSASRRKPLARQTPAEGARTSCGLRVSVGACHELSRGPLAPHRAFSDSSLIAAPRLQGQCDGHWPHILRAWRRVLPAASAECTVILGTVRVVCTGQRVRRDSGGQAR